VLALTCGESGMAVILYEDIMLVGEVDPDGKRFDKGALCRAASTGWQLSSSHSLPVEVSRRQLGDGHVARRQCGYLPVEGALVAAVCQAEH